jgi:hypothetical protein
MKRPERHERRCEKRDENDGKRASRPDVNSETRKFETRRL